MATRQDERTPRDAGAEALALEGGPKAVTRAAPLWPHVDDGDRAALLAVLESRVWGGYHPDVAVLERRFAEVHGATHGVATANGTVSLEIALAAAGIVPGDEVIVPPITFVASATAILRVGAVPVFVDVDRDTLNLSPDAVAAAITDRTRAIVAVHFAGHPVDLDAIVPLCERRNLILVEDCAHAPGAAWRGRPVGSFGAFGSFSFQASKNLTAGEGGMLVTRDADLAERARSLANQGRRTGGPWYEHVNLGTNARMTGFQAALLLRQLDRLPSEAALRMTRATQLRHGLADVPGLSTMPRALDPRVTTHGWHLFPLRVGEAELDGMTRERLIEALQAEGVPVSPAYPHPLYHNELFRGRACTVHPCPEAEAFCKTGVWLPHHALLGDEAWIAELIAAVRKGRRVRAGVC